MKSGKRTRMGLIVMLTMFVPVVWLKGPGRSAAQESAAEHHHYKLVDVGTLGGPGSAVTEFQQC
jgi:hypothetical protein